MLPPVHGRSGAKRMIEQLDPQPMPVEQQAVDFQSLSAASAPVQRSLGAINISLEEYRFLSEKLVPQFRAKKALRANEAQSPTEPAAAVAVASAIRQPTLSLEVAQSLPKPVEPHVEGDIPRQVAKPTPEMLATPLAQITTQAVGPAVVPVPGVAELYGEECMSMVVAMGGKLMLPSVETVDVAITNPGLEAYDMFAL